jgi:hypothetical protein
MYIGNVILLLLNLPLVAVFAQLLRMPSYAMFPLILGVSIVGVYTGGLEHVPARLLALFGLLGLRDAQARLPDAPLVLGLVLGDPMEKALRQSLMMSGGDPSILLRPIPAGLLLCAVILLLIPLFKKVNAMRVQGRRPRGMSFEIEPPRRDNHESNPETRRCGHRSRPRARRARVRRLEAHQAGRDRRPHRPRRRQRPAGARDGQHDREGEARPGAHAGDEQAGRQRRRGRRRDRREEGRPAHHRPHHQRVDRGPAHLERGQGHRDGPEAHRAAHARARVFAVRADSPFKTLKEFIDAAKAKPGTLKQSGGSVTSRDNIIRQTLQHATGAKWAFVSFQGGGERLAALLGGHVDIMVIEPRRRASRCAPERSACWRSSPTSACRATPMRRRSRKPAST